jgi:hypothetical protein
MLTKIIKEHFVNLFLNACILGFKAHFGVLVYDTYVWFFFLHLRVAFSCENWKWFNVLKMKI